MKKQVKGFLLILIFTVLNLLATRLVAQDRVSISVHQDARFAFVGDDKGNPAGTIDLLFKLKMAGKQQKYGFLVIYPEYEYANLDGIYKRYSANIGYTFNRLIIDHVEATGSIGWGWIDRYSLGFSSFGAAGELAYSFKWFKVSLIGQFTERKDLEYLWGKNEIRFSGFFGVEIKLF